MRSPPGNLVHLDWLQLKDGWVGLDPHSGSVSALTLNEPDLNLIARPERRGLVRVAAPLPDYPAHYLETGVHGAPHMERTGDRLVLRYNALGTAYATPSITMEVELTPTPDGLLISGRVRNGSSHVIPQVVFPQLFGLGAIGPAHQTRLQLGLGRLFPFRELVLRPDDTSFFELGLYRYFGYTHGPST